MVHFISAQVREQTSACRRGEDGSGVGDLKMLLEYRVGEKEEGAIFAVVELWNLDWAADAAAVPVLPQSRARSAGEIVGPRIGVEGVIPAGIEHAAVEDIAAASRSHSDLHDAIAGIGADVLPGNAELADAFERDVTGGCEA